MDLIELLMTYGAVGIGIALAILMFRRFAENATDSLWRLTGRYPRRAALTAALGIDIVVTVLTYVGTSRQFGPGTDPALLMHVKLAFAAAVFCALLMVSAVVILLYAVLILVWHLHRDLQNLRKSFEAQRKNP